MSSNKETRKRAAPSRFRDSDEPLTKKPKQVQKKKKSPNPTPISQSSTPAAGLSRQSSAVSVHSTATHSESPPVTVEEVEDVEFEVERKGPRPKKAGRLLESSDGSDDDDEDDEGKANETQEERGEEGEIDPQTALDELYKTYKSPIYVFYLPPVFKMENDKRYQVFRCAAKRCTTPGGHIVKRNMDSTDATSTSNLKAHASKCYGEEVVKAAMKVKNLEAARDVMRDKSNLRSGSITLAFERAGKGKVSYSTQIAGPLESRVNHVKWMAKSKRPFAIVEDEGYHVNMKTGREHQYIPSAATVSRDVKKVFLGARERIAQLLQKHEGTLHFATDCWTSPNRRAYMAVTVQYETNGEVNEWLLDIVEVGRRHSGLQLAVEFTKILDDFGIADKILAITCDNASNNDVMVERMAKALAYFDGQASRVRCFAHVVNLVVKSVISQFDLPRSKTHTGKNNRDDDEEGKVEDEDDNGDSVEEGMDATLTGGDEILQSELGEVRELAGDLSRDMRGEVEDVPPEERESDRDDGWVDERWSMTEEELKELTENVMPARRMLVKLRKISYGLKNSPTVITPRWRELCKTCGLKDKNMPRDVRTRWNSTYEMLKFALEYRQVINMLTADREAKLRAYEIEDEEWEIAEQLSKVLKIFKAATEFFSMSKVSNITTVIPAMDHLDEHLASIMVDTAYSPAIRAAVSIGKTTLNKYYSKTDYSDIYRIAMVLDPRYKLAYFRKAGWENSWIDAAHELVTLHLSKYSEPTSPPNEGNDFMIDNPQLDMKTPTAEEDNMFVNFINSTNLASEPPPDSLDDELAKYLSTGVEVLPSPDPAGKIPPNPLHWWRDNRDKYPKLSSMAMDYLSIPASSVDVERVFSRGRIVLAYLRNRLSVQTVRSLLCVEEWLNAGHIKDKDMHGWLRGLKDVVEEDEADVDEGWDNIECN